LAVSATAQKTSNPDRSAQTKQHFPLAEYDEPELTDPAQSAAKKAKQKRHNNFKFVAKHLSEHKMNVYSEFDWEIVTAYELTESGALPLDESSQFEALRGKPSSELLRRVRALISE
jgi:hypothetical protein